MFYSANPVVQVAFRIFTLFSFIVLPFICFFRVTWQKMLHIILVYFPDEATLGSNLHIKDHYHVTILFCSEVPMT
jgi:hypothetical protein